MATVTINVQTAHGEKRVMESTPASLGKDLVELMTGELDVIQLNIVTIDRGFKHESVLELKEDDQPCVSRLMDLFEQWSITTLPLVML